MPGERGYTVAITRSPPVKIDLFNKVKIVEDYYNYFPPVHVYRSLELLLRYVPQEHLRGLRQITLTNSEQLQSRRKGKITSEKRRFRPAECLGLYGGGYITLIMDRIFEPYPEMFLLFPIFKTHAIGEILYHEIGHHIHQMQEPGFRDRKEQVADEWSDKLMRMFLRKRYWYLAPIRSVLRPLRPLISRIEAKLDQVPPDKEPHR